MDLDIIVGFMHRSHWAQNRPRSTIEKSIQNSLCFGAFEDDKQIGFARIVTDYCTFAYLCDVFVDERFRGRGVSKKMMDAIMAHPELQNLRRFVLATKDAHSLYERYGFLPLSDEEKRRYMAIFHSNI